MDNFMKSKKHRAKGFKSAMTYLLAFLMLFGIAPVGVLANDAQTNGEDGIRFFYSDGERISIDDERIINVVDVLPSVGAFSITPASTSAPNVQAILAINGQFAAEPIVYMGTHRVSAQRYAVEIDGVLYEAFCADRVTRS